MQHATPPPPSSPPPELEQALVLDLVADVAVLRAVMQALLRSVDARTRAEVMRALEELGEASQAAGLTGPGAAVVDSVLQRRLAAFEATLKQSH